MSTMLEDLAAIQSAERASEFIDKHRRTIAQNAEAAKQLGELLAVIHADGGHYFAEHGAKKSTEDAIAIYSSVLVELDSKRYAARRLKALEQAIGEMNEWFVNRFNSRAEEIMRGESNDLIRN